MNILLLTDHFYPDLSSGGRLLTDLSRSLAKRGEGVHVITTYSRYNTKEAGPPRENFNGFLIERVPSFKFSRGNIIGRSLNELSFCLSVFWRVLFISRFDIICVLSSPPFMPIFAHMLSYLKKIPYIYIMMDVFPDIAVKLGMIKPDSLMVKLWNSISVRTLKRASRIVVLGRCMKKVIERKLNKSAVPVDVIHNWADGGHLYPISRHNNPFFDEHPYLRDRFMVQYSGNLGRFQDFETILLVAKEFVKDPQICFLIIGEGYRRQWIENQIKKEKLSNTVLLPFQAQNKLLYSLNAANIALVTLEKGVEGLGVPSKFYPILAIGKPVIAIMSSKSEVALTIFENDIGYVVEQGNKQTLKSIIKHIASNRHECDLKGQRARDLFLCQFDKSISVKKYHKVFYSILRENCRGDNTYKQCPIDP